MLAKHRLSCHTREHYHQAQLLPSLISDPPVMTAFVYHEGPQHLEIKLQEHPFRWRHIWIMRFESFTHVIQDCFIPALMGTSVNHSDAIFEITNAKRFMFCLVDEDD